MALAQLKVVELAQPVSGSELIRFLLRDINGPEYSENFCIWRDSSDNMRRLLWSLAGLNTHTHAVKYSRNWLALPVECKNRLAVAIKELRTFCKNAEVIR